MTSFNIRSLNTDLQVIAREQLQEDPTKIQEYLDAFREWIKKSSHLKARTDDQFLVAFLRGCKYSLEKAKQKLDLFYTIRTHVPELFANRDPLDEKMHAIIRLGIGLPMPLEHPGAPRIMLIRPGKYDANKFNIQEVMRVATMMNDILLVEDDNLAVAGQIAIIDLQGVTLQHLIQMQPSFVKKLTMMMQDSNPVRQKGIHYINAPKSFEHLYNLFKSFMNEKMRSRLYVHTSVDSLYEVVPRRLLPSDYEGEAGSLESMTETWEKKILAYRTYYLEEPDKFGVDEKKRPGRPKNADSLFGIDGTFRQLQVD